MHIDVFIDRDNKYLQEYAYMLSSTVYVEAVRKGIDILARVMQYYTVSLGTRMVHQIVFLDRCIN